MGRPPSAARRHFVKVGSQRANAIHYWTRCRHCLHAHQLRARARQLQSPSSRNVESPLPEPIIGRKENLARHLLRVHNIIAEDDRPTEALRGLPPPPSPPPTLRQQRQMLPLDPETPSRQDRQPPPPTARQHNRPPPPAYLTTLRENHYSPAAHATTHRGNQNEEYSHAERYTSLPTESSSTDVYRRAYSPQQQRQFERFLLEFQVALALPDSYVEHPATVRLFHFLNPLCIGSLPRRRTLGGRILDEHANVYAEQSDKELRDTQKKTGGRVNFLSDVWQNIAKKHLLGVHLVLFGKLLILGLKPVGSNHDGVAIARQMEALMIEMIHNGWNIGAVITDDAGQCARARRILAFRWKTIHFGKCFAHDINNLVKSVLKVPEFRDIAEKASAAVKALNRSTSKWLPRANEYMVTTYELQGDKALALLTLCDTRWNSIQGCFASLLRVKTALKQFEVRYHGYKDLPRDVKMFGHDSFWNTLEDAERTVRPLCNASYTLQRDNNTLVDVFVCYRDIFKGFCAGPHANALVSLVEGRWKTCEQPLYMLALFLHPGHIETAKALPYTDISSIDAACDFAVFYFERFFPDRGAGTLRNHMDLYCAGNLYFNRDKTPLRFCDFNDPVRYWSYARNKSPKSNLPDLAIAVLSIAVNTATCERYFSEVGRIHTPTRNCLGEDKANKAAMVRQAVREQYRENNDAGQDQDNEVTEEDSEGNKYVGRIVIADERSFRSNSGGSYTTPVRSTPVYHNTTPRLQHSSTIPPPTPNQPRDLPEIPSSLPPTSRRLFETRSRLEDDTFDPTRRLDFSMCDTAQEQSSASTIPSRGSAVNTLVSADSNDEGPPTVAFDTSRDAVLLYWCSLFEQHQADAEDTEDVGVNDGLSDDEVMQQENDSDVQMNEGGELLDDYTNDTVDPRLRPIPNYNDPNFPQEKTLSGLRGLKVTLADLISMSGPEMPPL